MLYLLFFIWFDNDQHVNETEVCMIDQVYGNGDCMKIAENNNDWRIFFLQILQFVVQNLN